MFYCVEIFHEMQARLARRRQQQAAHEIGASSERQQAATAEQIEAFKKAFSVCLEAKKYMVRF